jgi:hypothetical protein
MNNGQQLHGLLNNEMLMNMVQRQQQEMSQQRGPQQAWVPLDRRMGTAATDARRPHSAHLQSHHLGVARQQHAGNTTALPSPLAGGSLSNPLVASGSPQDLRLRGPGSIGKRKLEDDEISVTSARTSNSKESYIAVDKEKVDAAFRSKPQPGKKRADLTEEERQELAKARNREHARQARCVPVLDVASKLARMLMSNVPCFLLLSFLYRMRKKARHEQLLHSEEMVVKMKQAEELKNKRCQNLFRFLSIRGYMLMNLNDEASASQQIANSVACMSLLSEVVGDIDKFQFNTNVTAVTSSTTDEVRPVNVLFLRFVLLVLSTFRFSFLP